MSGSSSSNRTINTTNNRTSSINAQLAEDAVLASEGSTVATGNGQVINISAGLTGSPGEGAAPGQNSDISVDVTDRGAVAAAFEFADGQTQSVGQILREQGNRSAQLIKEQVSAISGLAENIKNGDIQAIFYVAAAALVVVLLIVWVMNRA